MKAFASLFLLCLLAACATAPKGTAGQLLSPTELQCMYQPEPLGLRPDHPPFFSWWVNDSRRDATQSAWQVQVSTDSAAWVQGDKLAWDSGKQTAGREVQVAYAGKPLQPVTRYYWRVQSWDGAGQPSGFSPPAAFETGPANWQAQWISDPRPQPVNDEAFYQDRPNTLLRRGFAIGEKPVAARLFIAGLGYYEAYLNGGKVGDHVLDPGWTNFGKRTLYSSYDVTAQLQRGENALGVMLGNGWYNPLPIQLFGRWNLREILTIGRPKLLAELHLTFADGRQEVIASDESWQWGEGHILFDNVYLGEKQDGRRLDEAWKNPGFTAEGWGQAVQTAAPGGDLLPQLQPAVQITDSLPAVAITEPQPETFVVDFGQNFAGWIRVQLQGDVGQDVRFRYGELLLDDGLVNGYTTMACQIKGIYNLSGGPGAPVDAWQEDHYRLRGGEAEVYQPHFTFHGFRYVQVDGYAGELKPEDITGLRLSAALDTAGTFQSSNQAFNQIQDITLWTFLSNVFSIQSDCPGREKFGYGGDIVTAGEAYVYNFDMANFYRKTVRDFADDARPSGGMPECAPYNEIDSKGLGENSGPIGWQLAYPFVQDLLYRFYGDRAIIEEQYPAMQKLITYLESVAENDRILIGLSDHALLNEKPVTFTSSAFYYHVVALGARFAEILGKTQDQQRYLALAGRIKQATLAAEFDPVTGCFGNCNQSAQAIGLWYAWLDSAQTERALTRYQDSLARWEGHNSTGIFGTKMAFDVLRRLDEPETAYVMANQPDFPGWRYMLANGATTLWESWENRPIGPSHNHPMFGSISEWFYRSIGGINPAEDAVGCDRWVITPQLTDSVPRATVTYRSVRGEVVSHYERKGSSLHWDLTIPANTQARVAIPLDGIEAPEVWLDGEKWWPGEVKGVRKGDALWVELGSGAYGFEVK